MNPLSFFIATPIGAAIFAAVGLALIIKVYNFIKIWLRHPYERRLYQAWSTFNLDKINLAILDKEVSGLFSRVEIAYDKADLDMWKADGLVTDKIPGMKPTT